MPILHYITSNPVVYLIELMGPFGIVLQEPWHSWKGIALCQTTSRYPNQLRWGVHPYKLWKSQLAGELQTLRNNTVHLFRRTMTHVSVAGKDSQSSKCLIKKDEKYLELKGRSILKRSNFINIFLLLFTLMQKTKQWNIYPDLGQLCQCC